MDTTKRYLRSNAPSAGPSRFLVQGVTKTPRREVALKSNLETNILVLIILYVLICVNYLFFLFCSFLRYSFQDEYYVGSNLLHYDMTFGFDWFILILICVTFIVPIIGILLVLNYFMKLVMLSLMSKLLAIISILQGILLLIIIFDSIVCNSSWYTTNLCNNQQDYCRVYYNTTPIYCDQFIYPENTTYIIPMDYVTVKTIQPAERFVYLFWTVIVQLIMNIISTIIIGDLTTVVRDIILYSGFV